MAKKFAVGFIKERNSLLVKFREKLSIGKRIRIWWKFIV